MLKTRRLIEARADRVWDLLVDTARWPEWGPSVQAVECPTRRIGPGSRGRVLTAFGLWLPFRVTDWEDGRAWRWTVAGVPATGHRVVRLADDRCEVTFQVPMRAPFYLPVCAAALRRIDAIARGPRHP
jgi:hypothetical protein